jgi:hypothetical protein
VDEYVVAAADSYGETGVQARLMAVSIHQKACECRVDRADHKVAAETMHVAEVETAASCLCIEHLQAVLVLRDRDRAAAQCGSSKEPAWRLPVVCICMGSSCNTP